MRRNNKHIALFLLAVYLPMWLLSALHDHSEHCRQYDMTDEQTESSSEYDEDGCLLCQFLQQPYEETPQVALEICLPVMAIQEVMPVSDVVAAFENYQFSRAPPFCL